MGLKHYDIELLSVERIEEGNLLEFNIDGGNMHIKIIQEDDKYKRISDALNIFLK